MTLGHQAHELVFIGPGAFILLSVTWLLVHLWFGLVVAPNLRHPARTTGGPSSSYASTHRATPGE